MGTPTRISAMVVLLLGTSTGFCQDQAQAPFVLNLPEWNPDPESLPPELRLLDVARPVLPEMVAEEVAELEARIAEIEGSWLEAESREEQDEALDEAIGLAERVLAMRIEHQGNTGGAVRWRDAKGEPSEWHEVVASRQQHADLQLFRGLDDEDRAELASIMSLSAEEDNLYTQGRYAEATALMEEILQIHLRVLGDDHLSTLNSINSMGTLLWSQGKLSEAEPYWRGALEGRRRVLGDEHPNTLTSINNLCLLLGRQGRLFEAEPYFREAMYSRRRVLGDEHKDTLQSINNIGVLLRAQGRLSEAEPYTREALEGRRRVLGGEHADTLGSISNMGFLLEARGRLSEAEPYYREALDGSRRALGNEHPGTLNSIRSLGQLLVSQGRLSEAEPYYREALEGSRRVLGNEHPDTLSSVGAMAFLLRSQGRLSEAEPLYREALDVRRRVLGDEHPHTLTSINNMGGLLYRQGEQSEAELYFREAMEGYKRVLGDDHPETLAMISNMSYLVQVQGGYADATQLMSEILLSRRRVLGKEHPDTLTSISIMGALLNAQGRLAEAEPYYREALATAERLRVDIAGDASARAQFAGALNLPGIARGYARTLLGLDRASEALGVLERGRGRAGLDLFAGGRSAAEVALRATAGAGALARYDAALAAEEDAKVAVFEAEARLSAAPDEDKPARRDEMLAARRMLSEKTAAVFSELRGLVPAVDPMTSEQILATLAPGEALVTWAWADDGVLALVARDGSVTGVTLAKDKDETEQLREAISALHERVATRGNDLSATVIEAACDAALPKSLRELLAGATSVIAVIDGPLAGIPVELLLPEMQVAYAPTATIALRPRLDGAGPTRLASASDGVRGGVIVGDPVFAGFEREEPDYPETGILLAMVADESNAAIAGLTRGDVLLSYGEHELASAADLIPAIGATAEAMATRGVSDQDRPVTARVWRMTDDGKGEEFEVSLALGRIGVQPSQASPADGLRSMATFDRSADEFAANATALEQIRFYGGGLSPLPNTRLEAAALASMLGSDATLLLGPDATTPKLREAVQASPPRVLHLATHGLLGSSDRPLLASVALTTPEEPTGEDNGFVTLGDILSTWGGQLRGTELVTLSACDTASAVRQGDTMMALPLGLLIAGADTVVASLWKVDDKATALLMARFYSNWLGKAQSERAIDSVTYAAGETMPKLAALREAQQWLRGLTREQSDAMTGSPEAVNASVTRDPTPRRAPVVAPAQDDTARPYNHPFFWSAFVLYGSPL